MKPAVPVIVLAQLFGTSLWFSANSAADDLMRSWGITIADIGTLTNAVQLGFIIGTLSFALSGLADRFAELLRHETSGRARRDPAWFQHHDLLPTQPVGIQQRQRHLCGLARARRRFQHQPPVENARIDHSDTGR